MKTLHRLIGLGVLAGSLSCSLLHAELAWSTRSLSLQPPAGAPSVEADFRFENRGSSPVTIKDVTTSCGCTSATPDKTTYAPGESGVLHVVFNTAGRSGRQSKSIHVTTDEPKVRPITLQLEIGLSPSYVVAPRLLRWKHDEAEKTKQAFLRLAGDASYGPPKLSAAPEGFEVALKADPEQSNTFQILVTPRPGSAVHRGAVAVQLEAPGAAPVSAQLLLVVD
jgi:hypothetical protein